MITCIVGDPEDLTPAYMGWLAEKHGFEVIFLPENTMGVSWYFGFEAGASAVGNLFYNESLISLDQLGGAFVRLNPRPQAPPQLNLSQAELFPLIFERRAGLQWFLNHRPCPDVNRPESGRSNGSKPYQIGFFKTGRL